jgi:predicted nucleic acid-binding protein
VKVLVDTSVWSLAFRRNRNNQNAEVPAEVVALTRLIRDAEVAIIGAIRQEVLSGISDMKQFSTLKMHLAEFKDIALEAEDYAFAAECFNQCRARGIQGSHTDFLICAVALRRNMPIFTTDRDFTAFSKVLPIRLFEFGSSAAHGTIL